MEKIATIVSTRKKREIKQEEMDNLLGLCEELLWVDYFKEHEDYLYQKHAGNN